MDRQIIIDYDPISGTYTAYYDGLSECSRNAMTEVEAVRALKGEVGKDLIDPPTESSMEYMVVFGVDLDEFVKEVGGHCKEGWVPLGGICVDGGLVNRFHQAMIKEKK